MKRKIKYIKEKPSNIGLFRQTWLKKGFELVDITSLCKFKLGRSGWVNNFSEPEEEIYHIQVWYRDESIAAYDGRDFYVIDDEKHIIYVEPNKSYEPDSDFIIFRKVRI